LKNSPRLRLDIDGLGLRGHSTELSVSSLSKARAAALEAITCGSSGKEGYETLPSYLRQLAEANNGSTVDSTLGTTVALEVDGEGRFYRCFVALGQVVASSHNNLGLLYVDGAHSRCPEYDGKHLLVVDKNGNGESSIIAVALVPGEVTPHMGWFLQLCHKAGILLDASATFSDRGVIISAIASMAFMAQRVPQLSFALLMNLKFCLEHIIRNVLYHFRMAANRECIAPGAVLVMVCV